MKEKVDVFTEKRECSDLFAIAENKYRTEVSLYKDSFVASQQHNVLYMKKHWLSTAFLKKHRKI